MHANGYDKKFNKYYQIYKFLNVRGEQATAIILSTEVAASDSAFFKKLAQEGFHVPTTAATRMGLLKSLETQRREIGIGNVSVVDVTEQVGWLFGEFKKFVLPYMNFGDVENEVKLIDKHLPPESFSLSGTLEDWQSNVLASCTDNSNLMFSVTTAFAPPLMRLLNIESGGFQFVGVPLSAKQPP